MSKMNALLSRLDKVKRLKSKKHAESYTALCPAHADRNPSLCIDVVSDGRILIYCRFGCGASEVMQAVGLSLADLFPENDYRRPPGYSKDQIYHALIVADICESDLIKGILPPVTDLPCIENALKILNFTRRLIRGHHLEAN